jgi:hypothetical protein
MSYATATDFLPSTNNAMWDTRLTGFNKDLFKRDLTPEQRTEAKNWKPVFTTGFTLPDHYLKPMTKEQINRHVWIFYHNTAMKLQASNDGPAGLKGMMWAMIENANLAHINGFCSWETMQVVYKETIKALNELPIPVGSFGEQLKNMGKTLIGGLVGFVTLGPVGFFTGIASTSAKIIFDEKAKRTALIQQAMVNSAALVTQTQELKTTIAAKQQEDKYLMIAGVAIGAGVLIYVIS